MFVVTSGTPSSNRNSNNNANDDDTIEDPHLAFLKKDISNRSNSNSNSNNNASYTTLTTTSTRTMSTIQSRRTSIGTTNTRTTPTTTPSTSPVSKRAALVLDAGTVTVGATSITNGGGASGGNSSSSSTSDGSNTNINTNSITSAAHVHSNFNSSSDNNNNNNNHTTVTRALTTSFESLKHSNNGLLTMSIVESTFKSNRNIPVSTITTNDSSPSWSYKRKRPSTTKAPQQEQHQQHQQQHAFDISLEGSVSSMESFGEDEHSANGTSDQDYQVDLVLVSSLQQQQPHRSEVTTTTNTRSQQRPTNASTTYDTSHETTATHETSASHDPSTSHETSIAIPTLPLHIPSLQAPSQQPILRSISTATSSTAQTTNVTPTIALPSDNDWSYCIQNHHWDQLDTLLQSYDPKDHPTEQHQQQQLHSKRNASIRSKKSPAPKKKRRQLRVAKFLRSSFGSNNNNASSSNNNRAHSVTDDEHQSVSSSQDDDTADQQDISSITPIILSPLLQKDPSTGRTPLHYACCEPVPSKLVRQLLSIESSAASVQDISTSSFPLHLAIQSERTDTDLLGELIKAHPPASWQPDGVGKTPLMYAVQQAIDRSNNKSDMNTSVPPPPPPYSFWGFPHRLQHQEWQQEQENHFNLVLWLLQDRVARSIPLHEQVEQQTVVLECLQAAAPPSVVRILLQLTMDHLMAPLRNHGENDPQLLAGPILSYLISRQYPQDLWIPILERCPKSFLKTYKDPMGRGIVASHYRVACVVHRDDHYDDETYSMGEMQIMKSDANNNSMSSFVSASSSLSYNSLANAALNDRQVQREEDYNDNDDDDDDDDVSRHVPSGSSYRLILQEWALAKEQQDLDYRPSGPFLEWWDKLKLLLTYWATHEIPKSQEQIDHPAEEDEDEGESEEEVDQAPAAKLRVVFADQEPSQDTHEELLMVHSALTNSDIPASLLQLLIALYPNATELPHPKTQALPIHLACRIWKYRTVPPRKGEAHEVLLLNGLCSQLIESDPSYRVNKARYRQRLPIHHAIAAGKPWNFVQPLVQASRKSLLQRDPHSKLYPFLMAARPEVVLDVAVLTKQAFTPYEWNNLMPPDEKDLAMEVVETVIELEQLTLSFELLRSNPDAIDPSVIRQREAEKVSRRLSLGMKRSKSKPIVSATEPVVDALQVKYVQGLFHLGHVSAHYIGWAYDTNARGWKVHRCNLATIKEAIMDGCVSKSLHRWWSKLKFWIWQECRLPAVPKSDEFLLHAAVSNPDTPLYVLNLIVEIFPRSTSIALPGFPGCYPLHIAMRTPKYLPLPFEFPHPKTAIQMVYQAYPGAISTRWDDLLPLHLGIAAGKCWDELKFVVEQEPGALIVSEERTNLYPFQMMALSRPYSNEQRSRLEESLRNQVGGEKWRQLTPHQKVLHQSQMLEEQDLSALTCIWQLLRSNPILVCLGTDFVAVPPKSKSITDSASAADRRRSTTKSKGLGSSKSRTWMNELDSNLSLNCLDFLEEVYEMDSSKLQSLSLDEAFGGNSFSSDNHNNGGSSGSISLGFGVGGSSRNSRPLLSPENSVSKFDQSMSLEQIAPGSLSRDDSLTLTDLSHQPWANSLARAHRRRQSLSSSYHSRGSMSSPNSSIRSDQSFSLDQLIPRTFSRDDSSTSQSSPPRPVSARISRAQQRRRLSAASSHGSTRDLNGSDQSMSLDALTSSSFHLLESSSSHNKPRSSDSRPPKPPMSGRPPRQNSANSMKSFTMSSGTMNDSIRIEDFAKRSSGSSFFRQAPGDDDALEVFGEEEDASDAEMEFDEMEFDETEYEEADPNFASQFDFDFEERDPNFSSEEDEIEYEEQDPNFSSEEEENECEERSIELDIHFEDVEKESPENTTMDLEQATQQLASEDDLNQRSERSIGMLDRVEESESGVDDSESEAEAEEVTVTGGDISQLSQMPKPAIKSFIIGGRDKEADLSQAQLVSLNQHGIQPHMIPAIQMQPIDYSDMTFSIPRDGQTMADLQFENRGMAGGDAATLTAGGMYSKAHDAERLERLDSNIKHVVVISGKEAFIIVREKLKTLKSRINHRNHKRSWLGVLHNYGSRLNMKGLHSLRQDQDQQLVSTAMIANDMVVVDEDEDYIWIMHGIAAANQVESFDVGQTLEAAKYFDRSGEIGTWLDVFRKPELAHCTFQENENSAIVKWLTHIATMEPSEDLKPVMKHTTFMLTPSILRSSMCHYESGSLNERFPLDKQLAFALNRNRLAKALRLKRRIPVYFQMPRSHRYNVARKALVRLMERNRVLEVLKVKQFRAAGIKCKLREEGRSHRLQIEVQQLPVPYRMTTRHIAVRRPSARTLIAKSRRIKSKAQTKATRNISLEQKSTSLGSTSSVSSLLKNIPDSSSTPVDEISVQVSNMYVGSADGHRVEWRLADDSSISQSQAEEKDDDDDVSTGPINLPSPMVSERRPANLSKMQHGGHRSNLIPPLTRSHVRSSQSQRTNEKCAAIEIPSHLRELHQPRMNSASNYEGDEDESLAQHELFDAPSLHTQKVKRHNPWLAAVLKAKRIQK